MRRAEEAQRRLFAEGSRRAQVGHARRCLQRAAGRHDLAPDRRHAVGAQRPGLAALGRRSPGPRARDGRRREPSRLLDLADLQRQRGALVQQRQQLRGRARSIACAAQQGRVGIVRASRMVGEILASPAGPRARRGLTAPIACGRSGAAATARRTPVAQPAAAAGAERARICCSRAWILGSISGRASATSFCTNARCMSRPRPWNLRFTGDSSHGDQLPQFVFAELLFEAAPIVDGASLIARSRTIGSASSTYFFRSASMRLAPPPRGVGRATSVCSARAGVPASSARAGCSTSAARHRLDARLLQRQELLHQVLLGAGSALASWRRRPAAPAPRQAPSARLLGASSGVAAGAGLVRRHRRWRRSRQCAAGR